MQSKIGLVALGVMASLVLFGGDTAEAKSAETEKSETKSTKKVEQKKVIVTVKAGDTLSDIATKHKTSYIRIFNANESIQNPDMIDIGWKLRIPSAKEKLPNRLAEMPAATQVAVTSAAAYQSTASTQRGSSAGNTYAYGWCTWYAKEMRPDLPNNLGNGGQWVANAAAQGIPTGSTPRVGAIAEEPGHVAYVEAVNGGMITISEMGYNYSPGQVNRRTVPAANYRYIY
ncbi:MAG TPA: LysM peptidoglycan-binding domain-containing protein [Candidatus Saccharibacteria bacterium]|nr:LysM peptidoglycan-binding domain-containing protein [Candidatus Saccharibacteria bacterium]HRK93785.1 LysM peptidoglycan-binding domain-containing protein [Candidatus Saccharibacteria bacterium]